MLGQIGLGTLFSSSAQSNDLIIGHGDFRYKVDLNWGKLDSNKHPVKDCHEMVQDSNGRIILLTNHTRNNVIIYNKDGKLLSSWGNDFPGAHGLSLNNEGGEDFLYITDTELSVVVKMTLDGQEILRIGDPKQSDISGEIPPFKPTETAIADNGDIYVADGYGSQFIYVYDQKGRMKRVFGGRGPGGDQFYNAHGIAIDKRDGTPRILVTAREQNQLKYFSMDGEFQSIIDLPGAYICRPVINGSEIYLATIWSGEKADNSGFISILDKDNKLVSAPGGLVPEYPDGRLRSMAQALQLFRHPHDVCVDEDKNLYIPQWNAGGIYPIKLYRV